LQNFDCALGTIAWVHIFTGTIAWVHIFTGTIAWVHIFTGTIAWVHIFTASESAPTPTACYAASANPWTETIWDNVPHYSIRLSVSDTGRPWQK
jgi:hypothetical protein